MTYFWVIFAKYRAMHDVSFVCLSVCLCVCMSVILHTRGRNSCPIFMKFETQIGIRICRSPFDFRKNNFFMIFQNFKIPPPCPPGGRIGTNMQRAQLGPPMVHMAKFHQNRLKDLGARRVDDTHTHTDQNRGNFKIYLLP